MAGAKGQGPGAGAEAAELTEAPFVLVLIAALRREISHILPLLDSPRSEHDGGCTFTEGTIHGVRVALAETGMGKERALAAAGRLMDRYRTQAALSIGFAGAAVSRLRAGDLVLGEQVHLAPPGNGGQPGSPATAQPLSADPGLLDAARTALDGAGIPFHQGPILTVAGGLGPRAKQEAGTLALAVDMESYWVGQAMASRGVAFLAVRAVSDGVGDFLPEYEKFLDGAGNVMPLKATAYFLSRPRHLASTIGLARKSSRASAHLGYFVSRLARLANGFAVSEQTHGRGTGR